MSKEKNELEYKQNGYKQMDLSKVISDCYITKKEKIRQYTPIGESTDTVSELLLPKKFPRVECHSNYWFTGNNKRNILGITMWDALSKIKTWTNIHFPLQIIGNENKREREKKKKEWVGTYKVKPEAK